MVGPASRSPRVCCSCFALFAFHDAAGCALRLIGLERLLARKHNNEGRAGGHNRFFFQSINLFTRLHSPSTNRQRASLLSSSAHALPRRPLYSACRALNSLLLRLAYAARSRNRSSSPLPASLSLFECRRRTAFHASFVALLPRLCLQFALHFADFLPFPFSLFSLSLSLPLFTVLLPRRLSLHLLYCPDGRLISQPCAFAPPCFPLCACSQQRCPLLPAHQSCPRHRRLLLLPPCRPCKGATWPIARRRSTTHAASTGLLPCITSAGTPLTPDGSCFSKGVRALLSSLSCASTHTRRRRCCACQPDPSSYPGAPSSPGSALRRRRPRSFRRALFSCRTRVFFSSASNLTCLPA